MKRLSLRTRLTVWYTFALLVVLCLFAADVLWQQGRLGLRRVDRELEAFSATLANVVQDELTEIADPRAAAEEARNTVNAPGRAGRDPRRAWRRAGRPLDRSRPAGAAANRGDRAARVDR